MDRAFLGSVFPDDLEVCIALAGTHEAELKILKLWHSLNAHLPLHSRLVFLERSCSTKYCPLRAVIMNVSLGLSYRRA